MYNGLFLGIQGVPSQQGDEETGNNEQITTEVGTPSDSGSGTTETAPGGSPMFTLVLYMGIAFAAMYFFVMRPQKKREKQLKELQAAITTGDNIVTNSGLFGKVAEVGEDCYIIEFGTNRGVRIPVLKAEVAAVRSPKMTPQPKEAEKE